PASVPRHNAHDRLTTSGVRRAAPHGASKRRRSVMGKSTNRRRFLQEMTALGAAGSVSAIAASHARAPDRRRVPQAQGGATAAPASDTTAPRGLPRIHLMVGPGTLPSVGKDRMDLLRYRLSGNPRLTGDQLIEPLPEIAKIARISVDKGT